MTPRVCSRCKNEMKAYYSHSYGLSCKRELQGPSQKRARAYRRRFDPPSLIGRPPIPRQELLDPSLTPLQQEKRIKNHEYYWSFRRLRISKRKKTGGDQ